MVYHRISELPTDPHALCVTPEHFAEHLEVLRERTTPIPLSRLARGVHERNFPHRAVALTFDDGYADNLANAEPLLGCHEIAATVFVPDGRLTDRREFWWDELERIFLRPGILPQYLELTVDGVTQQWELGDAMSYDPEAYERHRKWTVRQDNDPTPRQRIFRALTQIVRALPAEEQRRCLDVVLRWAGIQPTVRSSHRTLTREETIQLASSDLIEIGAHTMTHPDLRTLTLESQRPEIRESKACLEALLGCPVMSFAYPYGSYTEQTVALVRNEGFTCACSTVGDVVWPGSDPLQLPRITVPNLDGDQFTALLEKWLHR